jgi:hypothetical protein
VYSNRQPHLSDQWNFYSHGDLLFLTYKSQDSEEAPTTVSAPPVTAPSSQPQPAQPITARRAPEPWETVVEDPADVYWRSQDGKIQRQRDANFCRHGSNAMCDYCMPLEVSPICMRLYSMPTLSLYSLTTRNTMRRIRSNISRTMHTSGNLHHRPPPIRPVLTFRH